MHVHDANCVPAVVARMPRSSLQTCIDWYTTVCIHISPDPPKGNSLVTGEPIKHPASFPRLKKRAGFCQSCLLCCHKFKSFYMTDAVKCDVHAGKGIPRMQTQYRHALHMRAVSGCTDSTGKLHAVQAEKKRKDYAFRRQFNEKPSIIPGCPDAVQAYNAERPARRHKSDSVPGRRGDGKQPTKPARAKRNHHQHQASMTR